MLDSGRAWTFGIYGDSWQPSEKQLEWEVITEDDRQIGATSEVMQSVYQIVDWLQSYSHLCSKPLGSDQKNNIADTSGQNEWVARRILSFFSLNTFIEHILLLKHL